MTATAMLLAAERAADIRPELALVRLLERLGSAVTRTPVAAYLARPADRVSGSIGEHVRHCLDHVSAFATIPSSREITYDRRFRGTDVERNPVAATDEISRLIDEIKRLCACRLSRPIVVDSLLERDGTRISARSTVGRELAFVVHHTVHHLAIIALLLDRLGLSLDDDLGVAPSTPRRH